MRVCLFRGFLAALIFLPSVSAAQAGKAYVLMSATAQTASTTGTSYTLTETNGKCIGRISATNNSGTTPTLDAKIEHSPTGAAGTFKTLESFTQQTTGGPTVEDFHVNALTTTVFPIVRAVTTLAGTNPNYDVTITFYCDKKR